MSLGPAAWCNIVPVFLLSFVLVETACCFSSGFKLEDEKEHHMFSVFLKLPSACICLLTQGNILDQSQSAVHYLLPFHSLSLCPNSPAI